MKNAWNQARMQRLSLLEQLVARSRLIGQEPKLCVWGGGNTSSKLEEVDLRGVVRQVLRVKGSGSDLKSCQAKHFTPLDMELVLPARSYTKMTDQEMVQYLAACQTHPQAPRASIEALLHAFVPHTHIDHTHADAILAITNNAHGQRLAQKLFKDELVWVSYVKPGFLLAKKVADIVDRHPHAKGLILEKHGLITWGDTCRESYGRTIQYVTVAERYFAARRKQHKSVVNTQAQRATLSKTAKRSWQTNFYPTIRKTLSKTKPVILTLWDDAHVMSYVNHARGKQMSQTGPATPDHMLRTKRIPLWVDCPKTDPKRLTRPSLITQIERYAKGHERTFREFKEAGMYMLDPYPRVILIPGLGMIASGRDLNEANMVAEIYSHSMQVQMDADLHASYRSLSLADQFGMEYWDMELAKLANQPPEKELARRVVLVTGACGAIGKSIASKLIQAGAHVVVADLATHKVAALEQELNKRFGSNKAWGLRMDVTSPKSVDQGLDEIIHRFGALDIVVSNAGVAKIAAIDHLALDDWEHSFAVNATGHFLVSRKVISYMREQAMGGSMIFITTKNVLAPGKDFGAYSTSKAAEAQLARIIAIENGSAGIRSNMVNPDGIFEGSGLWNPNVRRDRAKSYGIATNRLEDFYRGRNLLKERVTADDVAESVLFLAGSRSSKTTGCILTVDGGLREAFPR